MSRKNKKGGGRKSRTSTLRQHRQVGKKLSPPLMALPGAGMQQVPWLRDTFPDMLWLCMVVTQHGAEGMEIAARALDRINVILDDASGSVRPDGLVVTGELTAFEKIPSEARGIIINQLKEDRLYETVVPWTFARALMKYEDVPGAWLFDGWKGNEQIVPADEPERFLARIVEDHSHGQNQSATYVKALVLRAMLKADKLRLMREIGEKWAKILPRYPTGVTEEERSYIEASMRATFLAFVGPAAAREKDGVESPALNWARSFWRSNWSLYVCKPPTGATPQAEDEGSERRDDSAVIQNAREYWRERLNGLSTRLLDAARTHDPDLYNPDKHEVLTGIAYRMVRATSVLTDYPGLWTMEHGGSYIRALVEARIVLKWLIQRGNPEMYARFKAYGRGRLKLLKLHLEEYRESLSEPSDELDAHIDYLNALVNQDLWEEYQEISIEGNFAGVDTRKMAEQVGMLTEYRLLFAPASAAVHGEWATIDRDALVPCQNPLHRRHRIPREDVHVLLGPDLVSTALDHVEVLVDDYEEAIRATAQ